MMQELNYIRCGDYFIPDIKLQEETRSIGRWGRIYREYLRESNPIRFDDLCLTWELKVTNQMTWVGAMNSIRNRAEGIIKCELIYCQLNKVTRKRCSVNLPSIACILIFVRIL